MKLKLFTDREFNRNLLHLTLPILIQSLMLAAVAAADAFMLGGLEQNAMAAVSLATQIQFVQNMILSSVTAAGAVLGAQYWGKKDPGTVKKIFCLMLRLNGVTSLLFFLGCMLIPRTLMLFFTDEEVLIAIGIDYLRIAGWSYLLTGVSQCYLTLMKVSDRVAMTARISSFTVLLNIALNAVFIFGLFGLPSLGARGAAVATLIARFAELAWCVLASRRFDAVKPDFTQLLRVDRLLSKDFSRCCLPLAGAALLWGIGFTSYSALMGHLGTDAAAANSVTSVIRDLVCCACNGLSAGGGILVGNELGAGHLEKGKLYGDRVSLISVIIGVASALLILLITPLLMCFIRLTEGAQADLYGMMTVMAVYMIGRAINGVVINGVFAAGGDTAFDLYSLAVCMWGLALPLAALGTFVFHWPAVAVYACTCLDEVGKLPWVYVHYRKYKWVRDLTR